MIKTKKWREKFDLKDVILKSCPFCGSNNLLKQTTNPHAYWIECHICSGQTLSGISWEEAVNYWNNRTKGLKKRR